MPVGAGQFRVVPQHRIDPAPLQGERQAEPLWLGEPQRGRERPSPPRRIATGVAQYTIARAIARLIGSLASSGKSALLHGHLRLLVEDHVVDRVVDPATGRTSNSKYFAGGDCVSGGREVVDAVADGKRAARGIAAMLAPELARG